MSTLYYESSFAHHGIKGMKWGIRRYQNPDGTLTAKGRLHRAKQENRENFKKAKQENSIERGRIMDSQKSGYGDRMAKHTRDIAIANTASGVGIAALGKLHDRVELNRYTNGYRSYNIKGELTKFIPLDDLGTVGQETIKKMETTMSAISAASGTLAAGTVLYDAYKGIRIAKDIRDYKNYQKSKSR